MEIDIANEQVPEGVAVRVRVRLSGRETNRLFLSGDTLLQLPLDGALTGSVGSPLPRTSIFLSELVGLADGLSRVFAEGAAADAFADVVRRQLDTALEAL
ncbi:MAG: hypothetical protein NTW58_09570 [Actinobacteria bacterium]|nr:hypothetical protein [Actinomycetota bacterium]